MSLAEDLLLQAEYLAQLETTRPKQASLRRAVSAAYYALFHLLVREGATAFVADPNLKNLWCRTFNHSEMKKGAGLFTHSNPPPHLNQFGTVRQELREICLAFIGLQEARHEADYGYQRTFSRAEARDFVNQARQAFVKWPIIKDDLMTKVFFSVCLFGNKLQR